MSMGSETPVTEDHAREMADPHCLSGEAASELLRGAPWRRFAVMGDSYAEGVGDPSLGYADVAWPQRVADALRSVQPQLEYLNTGQRGLRAAQVRQTQLDRVLAFEPDLVNVACGGNDLLCRTPDLDAAQAEMEAIYLALRGQGAHIFACTVVNVFDAFPELAGFRDLVAALNDRIRTVAERHGATLVEMWDHPVRASSTLLSSDGMHFAMHGHAVLAAEIIRGLAGSLARISG
jgi:lysophospholipase L1-like esterase